MHTNGHMQKRPVKWGNWAPINSTHKPSSFDWIVNMAREMPRHQLPPFLKVTLYANAGKKKKRAGNHSKLHWLNHPRPSLHLANWAFNDDRYSEFWLTSEYDKEMPRYHSSGYTLCRNMQMWKKAGTHSKLHRLNHPRPNLHFANWAFNAGSYSECRFQMKQWLAVQLLDQYKLYSETFLYLQSYQEQGSY